jgi:2-haloacid dehalogenase
MPWPDAVSGLNRLRGRYALATLSNGNVSLLMNMARNVGLPWDCILSAELFGHYKPDPEVYQGAARILGLRPEEVMMVAAHPYDLQAAAREGLKTAYVPRPLEHGPGGKPHPTEGMSFDVTAGDFVELAAKLNRSFEP